MTICGRSEAKGAAVVAEIAALGLAGKAIYVKADLTNPADIEMIAAETDEAFGKCDGLVNCAAAAVRGEWGEITPDHCDWLYKLNMRAPILMTQAASKMMIRGGSGGSVVNIGSINSHGGQSNLTMYACTKGALVTMTKHAAWALRKHHIRSNYVAVGWMSTPAEDAIQKGEGEGDDWLVRADAAHPLGRILRPVDVAKLVVHLLSDDASMQSGAVIDFHSKFGLCCWDGHPGLEE